MAPQRLGAILLSTFVPPLVFNPIPRDKLPVNSSKRLTLVQAFDDGWCIVGRKNKSAFSNTRSLFMVTAMNSAALVAGGRPDAARTTEVRSVQGPADMSAPKEVKSQEAGMATAKQKDARTKKAVVVPQSAETIRRLKAHRGAPPKLNE
ncbi:hypothetical protein BDZ89DRAFT_1116761 [Hymenopellis radicata]|nr:hypothetical protein BDZ89DRAFT_1116761 [Hymenopellis radicata]